MPYNPDMPGRSVLKSDTVTIASGGTTSAQINAGNLTPGAILTPSALTSTSISFTVSVDDGGTFLPLYDEYNTLVSIPVATGRASAYSLGRIVSILSMFRFFKIVMSASEGADRTLGLVSRNLEPHA